ncbi:hypothetical protein C491_11258 [Natronococcus amylolyticus DSM 10524]|uniref:DUF7527 domain-containing protein n=1 Tax=Natronococcus amylolyticus DSM 10524 TaxID=1227497 RepID=L9X6M6_9EURY|nr:bZIP transcription factor [Natronococcus amylolyticus]ELY57081.1 hypothetical protein C491_11258 [Natronococcus amylolyticus DSM 10524]
MDSRTQERVERWDSRPFDGDLHALAGADFSGAVDVDDTWVFLLGGRIVGVIDGDLEAVAGGSGTAYEAPHRALPLLCSMEAQRGAPRGQYYTNETPLEEVDDTLQEGAFTGYVELSENVLSGDYYLVYYGGRRMAVAYIGNAERLLVGEEAFERAVDEVGIYDVIDVEVEVADVADAVDAPPAADTGDAGAPKTHTRSDEPNPASDRQQRATVGPKPAGSNATATASAGTPSANDDDPVETDDLEEDETRWQESRSVPSVDSEPNGNVANAPSDGAVAAEEPSASSNAPEPDADAPPDSEEPTEADGAAETTTPVEESDSGDARDIEDPVGRLEAERERLRARNQELSSTVAELRARIESLEAELEGQSPSSGPDFGIGEALSQTNLFVRYDSRSQPTLGTAHEDRVDRSEVDANLRLEYHTRFDDVGATVDGVPFAEALTDSMEFRFLEWLTTELFFEIRDTGRADGLADLYEGITRIDRVELRSELSIGADTEDGTETVAFDVVAYDKMGHPLLVAALNDSREPVSRDRLESVATDAAAVADRHPELAAALVVTRSYFEPGALEVVEEATKSGFLSRGSRLSYVNNAGYHLCLAESRSEGFHLTVPEL